MKYKELADILKKHIDNGKYQENGKLPKEDMLMSKYEVTRHCVRNAIKTLVEIGCVYTVQGSGMFIHEINREGYLRLSDKKGLYTEFGEENIETKLVRLKIVESDEKFSEIMKCKIGTPIYDLVRLRIVKGNLYAVEYAKYNKDIIRYLNKEITEKSLYNYIKNDLGLNIGFSDKIIRCEKLDEEASGLLQLQTGEPALIREEQTYLSNGKIFNVSKVIYNYKYVKLFNIHSIK